MASSSTFIFVSAEGFREQDLTLIRSEFIPPLKAKKITYQVPPSNKCSPIQVYLQNVDQLVKSLAVSTAVYSKIC